MDPYNEQRLRDEVLYLHSLYHHGHPNPNPTPLPPINLKPLNPTRFKKPKSKSTQKKPKPGSFSGKEWPLPPPQPDPVLNQSGWPELKLKPKPNPQVHTPSPQELVNRNWNHVQQRTLDSVKRFYSDNAEMSDEELSDGNEEDEFDDDMVDDGENADDKVGGFFRELFSGDVELKDYYVKYCGGGGEFLCLVCGGANEKFGKRFKDCVALVQHSVSVAKTKKVRSHRAYGKVVCGVLGWEIDRLPSSIVSDHNNNNNDSMCSELKGNDVNSNVKSHDVAEHVDGESMVCEDISTVANVDEEHNKSQVLNEAEGCTGGAVNNLCRNLSSTMVLQPERAQCDLQTNLPEPGSITHNQ